MVITNYYEYTAYFEWNIYKINLELTQKPCWLDLIVSEAPVYSAGE